MNLKPMYKAKLNSPETNIIGAISATDTQFSVVNIAAVTPDDGIFPILLMIGGNRVDCETVWIVSISGNTLTVERGYESVARAWAADEVQGELIAANFGAQHHNAFVENIKALLNILAEHYTAIFGHILNTDVHVTAEYINNLNTILAELVAFTENEDIFVTAEQKATWDLMAQIANDAMALAKEGAGKLTDHEARVLQIEDALFNRIHTNPFLVTFGNLAGVTVTRGIYNPVQRRIEC